MDVVRKLGLVALLIVAVVGVLVGAFFAGVLGAPSAGLEDRGDWGTVTDQRTEVVTTAWVDNPNPVGVSVGDAVELSYTLSMNGIGLATGIKTGVSVPAGNDSVRVSTFIRNQELPPWWVQFIRANETIPVYANASVSIDGPVSRTVDLPAQQRTLLANATPVLTALSAAAGELEGEYTAQLSDETLPAQFRTDGAIGDVTTSTVTAGYEIRSGAAEWGAVTESITTVRFRFRLHNPGEVPVPAAPSTLGLDIEMNEIELFTARANDTELANAGAFTQRGGQRFLLPDETQTAVYVVEMDNQRIDEWFKSHVRQGEQTDVQITPKLVFSLGGAEFAVPEGSPVAYRCGLQTDILVDEQETATDCGEPPSDADESSGDTDETDATETGDGNTDDESGDGNGTTGESGDDTGSTDEGTENSGEQAAITLAAAIDADPPGGSAPVEISFDAGDSTAAGTTIASYEWSFDGGALPGTGERITRVFKRAGTYEVELTITDAAGNTDTETVTIDVASPV